MRRVQRTGLGSPACRRWAWSTLGQSQFLPQDAPELPGPMAAGSQETCDGRLSCKMGVTPRRRGALWLPFCH